MIETLQINPKFEQIIPPLSDEEFTQLEANILKEGRLINPIVVWNDTIIDGHNRYKIIQKHSEIDYSLYNISFEDEYGAMAWICNNQLGRRNLTEQYQRYLRGKRYNIERNMEIFKGNQYTPLNESGCGENRHNQKEGRTRNRIAKELGVSEWAIRSAADYAAGIDIVGEISPRLKHDILTGQLNPQKKDVEAIARLPVEKRKEAVELLLIPKDERKSHELAMRIEKEFENGSEQEREQGADPVLSPESSLTAISTEFEPKEAPADTVKSEEREIEECILDSMIGAVNMFIDSINNYLSRFPRLRTDPKYRGYTREIMVAARDYINDVEGDLL